MDDTAVNDIARFFRRLQWALVALGVLWLVWLMGPVLTPFVVAALLGWLGDPLVDRLQRAGRSRNTAVVLVFRSEEHTSELQSLMRISYAVFCLKKKKKKNITY